MDACSHGVRPLAIGLALCGGGQADGGTICGSDPSPCRIVEADVGCD